MALFFLEPLSREWETPSYVVRAADESAARDIASRYGERHGEQSSKWLDASLVSCAEIAVEGEPGVVSAAY